jgi:NAD(P)-dependent dehydrogenase (short-subunit alcohol dehydrogenase family)
MSSEAKQQTKVVLVTGGSGLVGQAIKAVLQESGEHRCACD